MNRKSNPLVSIALCTYNGERFLQQQLDSLVNQSYDNLEIIAVDDKSTDNTLAILKMYETKYKFLKIHQNETNIGFRLNFETALLKCSGEFLALCDQDDIWDLDKIKVQVENINENTLVYHDSALIDSNGLKLNKNISDVINMYSGNKHHYFLFENCISGHTCLFSRSLLKDLLPLPETVYHDRWLGFIATLRGNVLYLDQTLVDYRQHSSSTTDILRLKNSNRNTEFFKRHRLVSEIGVFRNPAPQDIFISKLHRLLKDSLAQYLCPELFLFVYRNRSILMYFKKKSALSIFNHSLKFLWGIKMKKVFHLT